MVIFHLFLYVYHRVKPDEVVHHGAFNGIALNWITGALCRIAQLVPDVDQVLIRFGVADRLLSGLAFDQWGISNQVFGDKYINH